MSSEVGTKPAPGSFRELLNVAFPLILSSGSLSMMHIIDRVFLTWYSSDALAASTPAGMLHWTIMSLTIGTLTYVNTFVSQYEGAKRPDRVSASIWQGVYLAIVAGGLFMMLTPLAPWIFSLIGHRENVQRLEVEYFSVFCLGTIPITLTSVLSCFYSGRGENRIVMYVDFAAVAMNAVLAYGLVFGFGPIPSLGMKGAAIASVLASTFTCVAFSLLLLRHKIREQYQFWKNRGFDRELFLRLLRYGCPSGAHWFCDVAAFAIFIFLIGKIDTSALAASNMAFNLNTMAFIPMTGFGTAVLTLVGRRIGEGRPELAVRTTWLAGGVASVWMLSFGAIFVLAPNVFLQMYTAYSQDEELKAITVEVVHLLRFVALYSFFDGLAIVFGSAVRGAGDTLFPLLLSAVGAWTVMVMPSWYAVVTKRPDALNICWWSCSIYVMIAGLGMMLRFRTGKWKTMKVIESTAVEVDLAREVPVAADV